MSHAPLKPLIPRPHPAHSTHRVNTRMEKENAKFRWEKESRRNFGTRSSVLSAMVGKTMEGGTSGQRRTGRTSEQEGKSFWK